MPKVPKLPKVKNHPSNRPEMKPQPYQMRLAVAMQQLDLAPGSVATVHVQHDDGCPVLAGETTCRCSPDIFIQTHQGRFAVAVNGSVSLPASNN